MNRCKTNIQYYLDRGYTEDESIKLSINYDNSIPISAYIQRELGYDRWCEVRYMNCSLKKEHMIEKYGLDKYLTIKQDNVNKLDGTRDNQISKWIKLGYTNDEAISIVSKVQRSRSKRCIEYWLTRGYSITDSIKQVSQYQDMTSKKSFIKRYGESIGIVKYENWRDLEKLKSKWSIEYWLSVTNNNIDEATAKLYKTQSNNAKCQCGSAAHWIKLGFSEADSIILAKRYSSDRSIWCVEYWISKGYSYDEAIEMVSDIQSKNNRRRKNLPFSNLELKVRELLVEKYPQYTYSFNKQIMVGNDVFYPDIIINELNICIEIYGDFWHANPSIYDDLKYMHSGLIAKEIRTRDEIRINKIKPMFNDLIILWESEIIKNNLNNVKIN